ncbi:MAG: hypothetical protein QM763_03120 [Agriterribacter sp.]
MRIYQLFHTIIDRFVPMDETSKNELQLEAAKDYTSIKLDAERIVKLNQETIEYNALNPDKQKPLLRLTSKHKVIQVLELWYVRYIIAASYVVLVRQVKDFMNGKPDEDEEKDDNDDGNVFEEFKNFMRFKKQMI